MKICTLENWVFYKVSMMESSQRTCIIFRLVILSYYAKNQSPTPRCLWSRFKFFQNQKYKMNVIWIMKTIISFLLSNEGFSNEPATMAEWLRRQTWNLLGFSRTGSNPVGSESFFASLRLFILSCSISKHVDINLIKANYTKNKIYLILW